VAFGNPSLSVFGGYVDTWWSACSDDSGTDDENNDDAAAAAAAAAEPMPSLHRQGQKDYATSNDDDDGGRIVAMVDVPPEQVPDGVLNLVRAHRPNIEHVRVVITDDSNANDGNEAEGGRSNNFVDGISPPLSQYHNHHHGSRKRSASLHVNNTVSAPVSGSGFVLEAGGFARNQQASLRHDNGDGGGSEEEKRYYDDGALDSIPFGRIRSASIAGTTMAAAMTTSVSVKEKATAVDGREEALRRLEAYAAASDSDEAGDNMFSDDDENSMTYLVLFHLSSNEAAGEFVNDLDGRPYTTLQEDVTCSLCRVSTLKGDGGVSLMSPFFATSSIGDISSGSGKNASKLADGKAAAAADAVHNTLSGGKDICNKPSVPRLAMSDAVATRRRARSPITASGFTPSGNPSEAHNCAVCLERLDASGATAAVSAPLSGQDHGFGIITTVCNHTFHIDCLLQWQDSPCPVCRFDHSGLNEVLSSCHVCGTTEHNYVCLICGAVSCGGGGGGGNAETVFGSSADNSARGSGDACVVEDSYNAEWRSGDDINDAEPSVRRSLPPVAAGHARQHYDETLHAYALDTETQHVWDFAGQGYVHRLIQNKEDGKLVEVNDPTNTSSQERTLSPGLSDAQEDEVLHRKLEGFASQYYTVLKSQLEQQRIFYEAQLQEIRREHDQSFGSREGRRYGQDLISALKQEKNQVEQRCLTLRRKLKKVMEDIAFLHNMNESLEGNKEPMRREIMEAQRQRAETRDMLMKCLPPLEAKLAMLFTQLEGGSATTTALEGHAGADGDKKPAARG